jgi:biotin carboxylase
VNARPTVLFLGASPQQLAPVRYARAAGYRVVTCDNRPANPGHALADAWHEVSTLDVPGVLAVADAEAVDAVVCYASDVSAPTAAAVAAHRGLPGNPVDAVALLTRKTRFRAWQREQGFFVPAHRSVTAADLDPVPQQALLRDVGLPLIAKPVDASGGKGVAYVHRTQDLDPALRAAVAASPSGEAIAEAVVARRGHQVCGEGFLVDGRIAFVAFADEHFAEGRHVPVGETFPGSHAAADVARATAVLQDLFERLRMRTGAFNFDLFFAGDEVFVVEIGPRNGGNRMPDAVRLAYGVDLVAATVEAALGRPVALEPAHAPRCHATYSVHSRRDGVLAGVRFAPEVEAAIVDWEPYVAAGEPVHAFTVGNRMLGNLLLRFDAPAAMHATMARMDDLVEVALEGDA